MELFTEVGDLMEQVRAIRNVMVSRSTFQEFSRRISVLEGLMHDPTGFVQADLENEEHAQAHDAHPNDEDDDADYRY